MRSLPTGRLPFPRLLPVAAASCALALGCGYANVDKNVDRHPNVMTGMAATVLMPGQTAPALPIPGAKSAASRSGPGGTSGSSGGYGAGAGGPGAYGQESPPAQAPAQAPVAQPRSSYAPPPEAGPPAVPQQTPGGSAPTNGNFTFIGGGEEDVQKHEELHNEPLWLKPLLYPLAVVAFPFTKAYEAAAGEPTNEGPSVPHPSQQPARPPTHEELQAQQEAGELQSLERQLGQPQADPVAPQSYASAAPAGAAARRAPGTAAPSIAQELEALRARREGRAAPAPTPAAGAAPAATASAAGAPAPTPSGVAPRGAAAGGLADQVEDRDGDGRPDHFVYRESGRIVREAFDDNGDGAPDRILYRDETGTVVVRSEEDTNGDGRIDTWTQYEGTQIARRRADTDGDGTIDTWTFYKNGQVARLEQDTNGDGFHDRIEFYDNGKRVREELDRNGDGRPDVITQYDANDQPSVREEDQDGDGVLDVRSFYHAGKLARREVMNEAALSAAGATLTDPSVAAPPPQREPGT
jgi:antitoxin component YwqK of YwqJK toxin-antitoxin module